MELLKIWQGFAAPFPPKGFFVIDSLQYCEFVLHFHLWHSKGQNLILSAKLFNDESAG